LQVSFYYMNNEYAVKSCSCLKDGCDSCTE
jgi:hypothetical protein